MYALRWMSISLGMRKDDDVSHGKRVIGVAVMMSVTVVLKKSDSVDGDETKTVKIQYFSM